MIKHNIHSPPLPSLFSHSYSKLYINYLTEYDRAGSLPPLLHPLTQKTPKPETLKAFFPGSCSIHSSSSLVGNILSLYVNPPGAWWAIVRGVTKSWTRLTNTHIEKESLLLWSREWENWSCLWCLGVMYSRLTFRGLSLFLIQASHIYMWNREL